MKFNLEEGYSVFEQMVSRVASLKINETNLNERQTMYFLKGAAAALLMAAIDELKNDFVYVVTFTTEDGTFVDKVFLEEEDAEKYASQFEGIANEYPREITPTHIE